MYKRVSITHHHPDSVTPTYAYPQDSGLDLYAVEDVCIPSIYSNVITLLQTHTLLDEDEDYTDETLYKLLEPTWKLISIGISLGLPEDYEIQIRSKSGLAAKDGLFVLNSPGTVDEGYKGLIQVNVANFGIRPYRIKARQKVAQMVLSEVDRVVFVDLHRIDNGHGSTGLYADIG